MNLRVRCKHLIADTILLVPIFLLSGDFGEFAPSILVGELDVDCICIWETLPRHLLLRCACKPESLGHFVLSHMAGEGED